MTFEEALKTINMNLQVAIHDLEGLEPEYEKNQIEALKISRDAVEKQIPKKPRNTEEWGMDRIMLGHCPICGAKLNGDMKFCNKCGQALDWSDKG